MTTLRHGRIELALHRFAEGNGTPLLLLHGLGSSAERLRATQPRWRGPVHALDFSGHGQSGWLAGGAYYPEMLAADADAALAELGGAVLCGWGLGAWVALLLAGARPGLVPAALLLSGEGLEGGGALPDFDQPRVLREVSGTDAGGGQATDPAALGCLTRDIRPEVYACDFARAATRLILVEDGQPRPPWWQSVSRLPGVETRRDDVTSVLADSGVS